MPAFCDIMSCPGSSALYAFSLTFPTHASTAQVEAAMAAFEQALSAPDLTVSSGSAGAAERRAEARAGVARCTILLGDVERGMELTAEVGSQELLLQCAELLEGEGRSKEVRGMGLGAGRVWLGGFEGRGAALPP